MFNLCCLVGGTFYTRGKKQYLQAVPVESSRFTMKLLWILLFGPLWCKTWTTYRQVEYTYIRKTWSKFAGFYVYIVDRIKKRISVSLSQSLTKTSRDGRNNECCYYNVFSIKSWMSITRLLNWNEMKQMGQKNCIVFVFVFARWHYFWDNTFPFPSVCRLSC
mgnify:CR=1 FL=1